MWGQKRWNKEIENPAGKQGMRTERNGQRTKEVGLDED